jgi:hypothetical protein
LSKFNLKIKYILKEENTGPDGLSRPTGLKTQNKSEEAAFIFSEKQFVDSLTNRDEQEENINKQIHENIK